jgi:hypothetical protein
LVNELIDHIPRPVILNSQSVKLTLCSPVQK